MQNLYRAFAMQVVKSNISNILLLFTLKTLFPLLKDFTILLDDFSLYPLILFDACGVK